MNSQPSQIPYIGRFAPTPSGPLHMGSLVCALASYLDAKAHGGQWLLRIEDIDPPREQAGADTLIITTLRAHGLHWDSDISYQSQHSERYEAALSFLAESGFSFRCACTRKRVAALGGPYDHHCLGRDISANTACAIRLNLQAARAELGLQEALSFTDRTQLRSRGDLIDDFIIRRKDGLFAYQLAVVADDIAQGITDVVRGYDLFDMTASQIALTRLLGGQDVRYAHIPIVTGDDGCKLSKQSHAAAVEDHRAQENLRAALWYLRHPLPRALHAAPVDEILKWAIDAWDIEKLRKIKSVTLADFDHS